MRFIRLVLSVFLMSSAALQVAHAACPGGENRTQSQHRALIGGKTIEYTATLGFVEVTAPEGKDKGCIFFTSYNAAGTQADKRRPVVFTFNGGPGSSSIWLHLGLVGPRRVDLGLEGMTPSVQGRLIDNNESLLDVADVVLIDPISTGFSFGQGATNDPFFGAKNDYKSVAEFIRSYLNEFGRWSSPKYIMGESYGGIRGPLLARYLQDNYQMGISIDGLILISPALTFAELDFGNPGIDLPYVLFLPSFAATAAYHGKTGPGFRGMKAEQIFAIARDFAEGDYFDALLKGDQLGASEYSDISRRLSELTGVPQKRIEDLDLRISDGEFFGALFQDRNQVVGRLDSRFVGGRRTFETGSTANDPSMNAILGTYTSAMNTYLRDELGLKTRQPYLTFGNITSWSFDSDNAGFGVMNDLNQAMIDNPLLRVYVATGYYDLACAMEAVLYDFRHLSPRLNLSNRVQISRYEAGHMMYIQEAALKKLKAELSQFVTAR